MCVSVTVIMETLKTKNCDDANSVVTEGTDFRGPFY